MFKPKYLSEMIMPKLSFSEKLWFRTIRLGNQTHIHTYTYTHTIWGVWERGMGRFEGKKVKVDVKYLYFDLKVKPKVTCKTFYNTIYKNI